MWVVNQPAVQPGYISFSKDILIDIKYITYNGKRV